MTQVIIDNANDSAIVLDTEALDSRSLMLASAASIVEQTVKAEAAIGDTAKSWGTSLFRAVYRDNANLDALIGDSKVAAGWQTLGTSDNGKKAKGRLEVYFSNARLVAEKWSTLSEEQRDQVLAGLSSIHYLANGFRKAEADAKKAAKKAAELEAAKAQADASEGEANANANPVPPVEGEAPSLASMAEALLAAYRAAPLEEREAAHDAIALLVEAVNSDVEVTAQPEVEAIAA
jgi:hypothetical protein